mgnify:CR=1 FL=1
MDSSKRKKELDKFPSFKANQAVSAGHPKRLVTKLAEIVHSDDIHEALKREGLTPEFLAASLKTCIEATSQRLDKHQHTITSTDLKLRLSALKLVFLLRGDMRVRIQHENVEPALFNDIDLGSAN